MNPIKYFAYFRYVPTVSEFCCFSQTKRLPAGCRIIKNRVVCQLNKRFLAGTLRRQKLSLRKLAKNQRLLTILGSLPWIKYLGISGSVSMLNANEGDDVDLFVITKAGQLWTGRFVLVLLTSLFGVRRFPNAQQVKDKLCFNLFFSEQNLKIPKAKQTEYVGHELLQLKTVINKEDTHEKLLANNPWVFKLFPQAPKPQAVAKAKKIKQNPVLCERLLGKMQLALINRHQTNEIITNTQLWFFPSDFEKQLAKNK